VEHHRAGRLQKAERLYRVAIGLAPNNGDALRLLGALYIQSERPEQALLLLQDALKAQPNSIEILNNLGLALLKTGRNEEAGASIRQALAINPAYVDAHYNLGVVFINDDKFDNAIDCFERALSYQPDYAKALNNLGYSLRHVGKPGAALEYLKRAIQISPTFPEAYSNIGALLYDEGKVPEALEYYDLALTQAPGDQSALWGKSLALLALGNYREGWKLHDKGFGHRHMRGFNQFPAAKPWDGEPAPNKHLLIWTEHGLGDALQFIRYAELCKTRVGKLSVLCQTPLIRLFKSSPFIDDAFDKLPEGNDFNKHVPLMSLPHVFETVLETVPNNIPYLRVAPDLRAKWAPKFFGIPDMKVGLVWAGGARIGNSPSSRIDQQRNIALEHMKPWLDLPGARFYNLQKDKPAEQIAALGLTDRLTEFMGEVRDFADTAAIVQNLDLVITVDTSMAHLAGSLGRPVWVLSRYNACWRWLQNRPDNPWYPTARIFGQPKPGDWHSVIAQVKKELALLLTR
jgi:tetratricopeptide (TPR) repeat protein